MGECPVQNWFSVSSLLDYLNSKDIYLSDLDFDEFGMNYNNAHIDIYDGTIKNEEGDWVIDWENAPEFKTEDIKDFFAKIEDDWKEEFNKFLEFLG